jgi:hypothetical protein
MRGARKSAPTWGFILGLTEGRTERPKLKWYQWTQKRRRKQFDLQAFSAPFTIHIDPKVDKRGRIT